MKRFRYIADPLCLLCCSLYALNRWWIKPHTHNAFMRFHFNDMLLIPCALPPLLLMQRWLKLRTMDDPPTWGEVALYTVFWSILFEVIGPHLMRRATGDPGTLWFTSSDVFLERHGFKLAERVVAEWGLLRSDRWQRAE